MMQSYCEIMSQRREQEAILLQDEEKQELLAKEHAASPSEPSPILYFYNADYDNISTPSTTYTITPRVLGCIRALCDRFYLRIFCYQFTQLSYNTSVSFPFEGRFRQRFHQEFDGPPIMPEDPYAYIMVAYEEDELLPAEGTTTLLLCSPMQIHRIVPELIRREERRRTMWIPKEDLAELPLLIGYIDDDDEDEDVDEDEDGGGGMNQLRADSVTGTPYNARLSIRDGAIISLHLGRDTITPLLYPITPPNRLLILRFPRVVYSSEEGAFCCLTPTSPRSGRASRKPVGAARQDRPTIAREDLYGFIDMVDVPPRCSTSRELDYGITDTWIDLVGAIERDLPDHRSWDVTQRVTDLATIRERGLRWIRAWDYPWMLAIYARSECYVIMYMVSGAECIDFRVTVQQITDYKWSSFETAMGPAKGRQPPNAPGDGATGIIYLATALSVHGISAISMALGNALTWWNSHVKTTPLKLLHAMPWRTLKKMMTDKYCPRGEIKKLEFEMWNLKVKGNDVVTYSQRFQELALMCDRMFPKKRTRIAIEFATELMDKKIIATWAERQGDNKGKVVTPPGTTRISNQTRDKTLEELMPQEMVIGDHTEGLNLYVPNVTITMRVLRACLDVVLTAFHRKACPKIEEQQQPGGIETNAVKTRTTPKDPMTYIDQLQGSSIYSKIRSEVRVIKVEAEVCSAPILALPEGSEDFIAYYDASKKGLGDVLMQREKPAETSRKEDVGGILVENSKIQSKLRMEKFGNHVRMKLCAKWRSWLPCYGDLRTVICMSPQVKYFIHPEFDRCTGYEETILVANMKAKHRSPICDTSRTLIPLRPNLGVLHPRPPEEVNSDNSDVVIESFSPSPIPVEDSDSLMEEIDLFLTPDDSMPPGIENDDYDSRWDNQFLEELL
ncbi:putative reverse transcriptase domain-containing protein [Tanacetum coccineum]|uniref:Reverse transcriptase domain-containing protein n=1 Tax=Tanacetum coccineum TaxID=301880 RepID=A0ABQ5BC57_9ASTR